MSPYPAWPGAIAKLVAVLTAAGGAVVLLGWKFDVAEIKSVLPVWRKMAPLTALNFLLVGASLWCIVAETAGRRAETGAARALSPMARCGLALAATVVLLSLVMVGTLLLYPDARFDMLLFSEPADELLPTKIANMTIVNFIIIGSALLVALIPRFIGLYQLLAFGIFVIGWLGVSRYLFGGEPLLPYVMMAAHTAFLFFILSFGLLCARADGGLMALLVSDTAGGQITRNLIPAALLVPVATAWLRLEGQQYGWYGTEAGLALYAIINVSVFGALVWINAVWLNRSAADRQRALRALQATEAQLRTVVENIMEGLAVSDLDGNLLHFNRAAIEMHGFRDLNDALRRLPEYTEIFELGTLDGRQLPLEQWPLSRILQGETLTDWEIRVRHLQAGWERIFSYGGSLVRDAAGRPLLAVVTIRDVTERRQAEQRIRQQLEHMKLLDQVTRSVGERQDLQSIFQVVVRSLEDSLPIDFSCICLYDQAENSLRVACVGEKSEALARELTMSAQAAIDVDENGLGRCVQGQLVYEPDLGAARFPFPERLARGGLRSLVMAPLRSESRVFGVLVAARRVAQGFNSVECEFLRQLSEHVALAAHQAQLYGALQQAYDDLRRTQQAVIQQERLRALGQMASGIAHDINNALSPVSLYAESLLETEGNLSARARGHLETIQRAVEDVAQTVARMREFYRPHEAQIGLAPMQMNSMVQQVVDLTRARWSDIPQQRGIMIRALTELAPELPKIMGVESEIREALTNLVFNAVDAMPEGGVLTLRTRVADADMERAAVVVEVADNGIGMDEETRRRCLEPFFTTKGERGTGLGLAMVFGMAQRHSAEIEIDSAPGAGTTVRLVFAVPTAVPEETERPAGALEAPSRLRLLLIDDDPVLLKSLRDALETDNHVITTANGGAEGISVFRTALDRGEFFAAVITDLGMPSMDGRRVAAAVKEISPGTAVILLTGWGRRLVAENGIPLHVDRVLAKPPKLSELREALAQLCAREDSEAPHGRR
jgi:signal transduction histidine kinase/PAS domain-containing protein/ActR/RegA family two-component response regulator